MQALNIFLTTNDELTRLVQYILISLLERYFPKVTFSFLQQLRELLAHNVPSFM